MEGQWGPEETRRYEMGLPVKTYVEGPGIFLDGYGSGSYRQGNPSKWAHTRKQGRMEQRNRSKTAYISLLSHLDRTGRLIVPTLSRQVAFEATASGFQGTARPSVRYPMQDDSPEAVADRIAWATSHRYLSEYHDKYSETARMSATARSMTALANGASAAAEVAAQAKQRPASAAPLRGASRPGSATAAAAAQRSSRPASAAARPSSSSQRDNVGETLANENFPKDWNSMTDKDLSRTKPWGDTALGQHVVAGSRNAKLVGSRYRLVPNHPDSEPVYTDYYGPLGGGTENNVYYGRKYTQRPGGVIARVP